MKKYLITIILSLLVGFFLSYYMIKEYDDAVMPTFLNGKTVYLIEQGVYSSYDNMINNTSSLDSYVYNIDNDLYYVYVGMSLSEQNALKIQKSYEFNTVIKTITKNDEFVSIIEQYDSIISSTEDSEAIKEVCKQLLSKYQGG